MIYPQYSSQVVIDQFHTYQVLKSRNLGIFPMLALPQGLDEVWNCPWSNKIAESAAMTRRLWCSIFSIFAIDSILCHRECFHYPRWIYFAIFLYLLVLELGVFWSTSALFHLCKTGSFWLRLAGTLVLGRVARYILLSWRTWICTWNKSRWESFVNRIYNKVAPKTLFGLAILKCTFGF